jgi:photosystem II stability/assembly factor-like uncharacterized protein
MLFSSGSRAFAADLTWSAQPSGTRANLYGVAWSNPLTWTAVGDGGTIIRSTDAGATWTNITSPAADPLRAVSFRGAIGLAVGISGEVIRSTDAGASWTAESRPTTKNLYSVSIGDSVAVITGEEGTILISTDGGNVWSPRTAGTAAVIFGVSVKGSTAVGVAGQGAIVMSSNTGQGWGLTVLGPPQQLFFYGTSFVSATTGWAVGAYQPTGSIILKSVLGGFVWTLQTAPTTSTLFGVSFTSLDSGTAVGSGGTIVRTTNGGDVWATQQSNTTQTLNAVSFAAAQSGLAVGDSGTILLASAAAVTGVTVEPSTAAPSSIHLEQNYPNPFNPSTTIRFSLAEATVVSLKVYTLLGREVATLLEGTRAAGSYTVQMDARGLASGVYLYRLVTPAASAARKFIVLK